MHTPHPADVGAELLEVPFKTLEQRLRSRVKTEISALSGDPGVSLLTW